MIIASDFQCPYCKMWHDSADMTIRREYIDNGKVRLAFINYPIGNHENAVPAAEHAMCAAAQGKFWEMHDALFGAQDKWVPLPDPSTVFTDLAAKAGVDVNALKACVASVKKGGVVVQAGTLPHEPLPFVVNEIMAKEIDLRGAFRWGIEFDWAVDYLSTRKVDVRPLLSGQYPLADAVEAFRAAADKNRSTKVQLVA
jgi:threonine dehydrogenase-like Zn-dependent dehydrogenase